ncbi:MAG: HlyD family efflux transporter periplasmic adaptor subunit [Planctomycetia bacterium]|nr:HlyD family efflux transporter periplasmic adaptor subunit [Planctomycetia bacterium]
MATAPADSATSSVRTGLAAPPRRLERPRTFADFVTQRILPLVAVGLLAFAGWYVWSTRPLTRNPAPPMAPANNPFADALAAAGIVEAQTENIAVGSATPGVVVELLVKVGDEVAPGKPLFRLDDRQLRGELEVKKAAVAESRSELVGARPRPEKIPVLAATVDGARALVVREADALKRVEETFARKVATEQELIERREALAAAQATLARCQADLDLLEAGSWQYDRDVAKSSLARAEAEVAKIEVELDRLIVRALVAGRVLQVNVRPGEYVGTPANQPLVILGNTDKLHVRVDIDEYDIPRFHAGLPAVAVPRGNLQEKYPLDFVRVEPFVVPKKSLTGDTTERVDTRVLQVIYEFDPAGKPPLFVGQQVEVFIDVAQTNGVD